MALMTRNEYFESIRKQNPNVYILGEKAESIADNPLFWTGINSVAGTYDVVNDPVNKSWATTKSAISGETISRWTHLPRSVEDVVLKTDLMRATIHKSFCVIRCAVTDTGSAIWSATWEMDQQLGTEYHKRFTEYWRQVEINDWHVATVVTDVKGDRMKRPSQQEDPDVYVHIVERRNDGIVVKGAKSNITGIPYAHEMIVAPTRDLRKGEEDYAVAFAIPVDTDGITMIARPMGALREEKSIERPMSRKAGQIESLVVFDNVFVPWERVFMAGEIDFCVPLVLRFANSHRQTKCSCKSSQGDLYAGAAALAAEVNGVERTSHVQDKIIDIIMTASIANACAYSSAYQSKLHPSGIYLSDPLPANVGKYTVSHNQGTEWIHLHDIAGGIAVTMPTQKDWENPITHEYMKKYYKTASNIETETRLRAIKLIEDLTTGDFAGWSMGIGLNGAGSPIAERIQVLREYDLKGMKKLARFHANIPELNEK